MGELASRVTPRLACMDDTTRSGQAHAALARFFEHYYAWRPVQATFTGVHDYDSRLPDWSPAGLDALVADMRAVRCVLNDAGRVEDDNVRGFPDEVDLALADGFLEIHIAEHECGHFLHQNPALWTGEAIFGVIALVTREFAPLESRLESTAARLDAIPAFLADARRVLRAAPIDWRARAVRECAAGARLCEESLPRWWTDLQTEGRVHPALLAGLNRAAAGAAAAFRRFAAWLEDDLRDAPPERASAGSALLALLLRRGHWCTATIEGLLAEARDALDEARAELDKKARELTPDGWPGIQERLTAAHPTAEVYLPQFERIWRACRDMAIERDLVTWPDAPIRYVPIPAHTRDVAPDLYYLAYRSPAPFDSLPIHDYVVPPIAPDVPPDEQRRRLQAAHPSFVSLNHVIHHGALGHHVQNSYASRGASRIGRIAAVDGASRIGMFSGGTLAEGWACYACDLADEAGFLTPLESVAQQHTRVRLVTRAVADLELHSRRRTLEQTTALYRERAAMTADAAHAEAVKNSMFPGAAVMYWLGTRDLHALRRACQARDGSAFTLRLFHDRVLSYGAIPVPLIARLMTATETPWT